MRKHLIAEEEDWQQVRVSRLESPPLGFSPLPRGSAWAVVMTGLSDVARPRDEQGTETEVVTTEQVEVGRGTSLSLRCAPEARHDDTRGEFAEVFYHLGYSFSLFALETNRTPIAF